MTRAHSGRDLLIDARNGARLTYGDVFERAMDASSSYAGLGVEPGDRVCLVSENSLGLVIAYFALLYLGATCVPLNPSLPSRDLRYLLEITKPRVVLASAGQAGRLDRSAALPSGTKVEALGSDPDLVVPDRQRGGERIVPLAGATDSTPFSITFTSGSTAFPKGVIHTIGSLFGNAAAFNATAGITSDDRFLHLLPMSYMAGFLNSLLSPFMAGAAVVVAGEFGARSVIDFWSVPAHFGVTAYWLAPSMLAMLLEADRDPRGPLVLRSGHRLFVGTAPLAAETKARFETRYRRSLCHSYGTSELLIVTVSLPERDDPPDSVGMPIEGVDVRIADAGGEVEIKTPFRSTGYLGEPETSVEEWSKTGDLGRLVDGRLVITGRKKDLIITGGTNVSPLAVERVLGSHPAVAICAAVGVPDPLLGERVVVAFVTRPGVDAEATTKQLEILCRTEFAPGQRPSRIVLLDEIPLTVTGKIKRQLVRDIVLGKIGIADPPNAGSRDRTVRA